MLIRLARFRGQEGDYFNSLLVYEAALVTLPCGVSVVLDPTAPQLGWKETLSPHAQFSKQRVHKVVSADNVAPKLPGSRFANEDNRAIHPDEDMLMEAVMLGLIPRIKQQYFLQLDEGEFTAARARVVAAAKRGLSTLAEEMNNLLGSSSFSLSSLGFVASPEFRKAWN
ncbi:hypothetical protein N657DRAFT_262986 [Parathielavia appendiculata]|uniref:Uncharacterized protein n=1 Tax=Parathielavia appendiculata TaxID=2587402 RepID=A0AAN6TSG7_9PEZI|nr:hypothetical protein N657DRAFT_262986 [Parathielavia appendiculata]